MTEAQLRSENLKVAFQLGTVYWPQVKEYIENEIKECAEESES